MSIDTRERIDEPSALAGRPTPAWDIGTSRDFMGAHEIRTAIFSVSIPGISVMTARQGIKVARQCNEFGARIRDDDPAHFGFFATVPDPTTDIQAALKEIRYSIDELQADGVCLLTRYGKGNDYIGHELFRPLWDELDEPEAVVFVHPTHLAGAVQINELTPFPVIDCHA
ncbi:hypothetical protein XPA_005386 [Xanthoria parietina]